VYADAPAATTATATKFSVAAIHVNRIAQGLEQNLPRSGSEVLGFTANDGCHPAPRRHAVHGRVQHRRRRRWRGLKETIAHRCRRLSHGPRRCYRARCSRCSRCSCVGGDFYHRLFDRRREPGVDLARECLEFNTILITIIDRSGIGAALEQKLLDDKLECRRELLFLLRQRKGVTGQRLMR
jgi:hypothetical protein